MSKKVLSVDRDEGGSLEHKDVVKLIDIGIAEYNDGQ